MGEEENLSNTELFRKAFDCYLTALNVPAEFYATKKKNLRLPILPIQVWKALCEEVQKLFNDEPLLLHAEAPIIIAGDIHGHILDLFRLLKQNHCPPFQKYLFLGDYVDRGEFCTETITLLFLLKVLYPDDVYIVRGNHEFREILEVHGFRQELMKVYDSQEAVDAVVHAFEYMPLACDIDDYIFCCHGGIGPYFNMADQLRTIPRPIVDYSNSVVDDIVWSDPSSVVENYESSPRYQGHLFGQKALQLFLDSNGYNFFVRGHQTVDNGVEYSFGTKMITVFSASTYCGELSNSAGFIIVKTGKMFDKMVYPPLNYLKRNEASFYYMTTKKPRPPAIPGKPTPPATPRTKTSGRLMKAQSAKTMRDLEINPEDIPEIFASARNLPKGRNYGTPRMRIGSLERGAQPPRIVHKRIYTPRTTVKK